MFRDAARKLAFQADYPEDALLDTPSVHIMGRDSVVVEGCRSVLLCCADRVSLDMGDYVLTIYGKRAVINSLSSARLVIQADITNIAFDRKGSGR
ncbi:MAG: YabP/YqfC family sporulation protein [Oscillospiraceae bacterium]